MNEQEKRKHAFVIYAPGNEHIMIKCDQMKSNGKMLLAFNWERDETGSDYEDAVACFNWSQIIGWEQVQ